jgi:hypothetical protein
MEKDLMKQEVLFIHVLPLFPAHPTASQNLGNFGLDNTVDAAQVSQAAKEQEKEKLKYRQGWVAGTDFRRIREARKAADQNAEANKSQDT